MPPSIRLAIADRVARITLDHPERLNALAGDMRERLVEALDRIAVSDVRVLVITGEGRAFCSGGDVSRMVELRDSGASFEALEPLLELGRAVVTRIAALPIPTVAAVNGVAAGAGMNLALACDLRFASDAASFGETFVRIGLHPDWGGTYFLPRLVGLPKALELCWTGNVIDASEALRIGLVDRVIPGDRFADETQAFVAKLAAAPQASVRAAKRTLRAAGERTLGQCFDAEAHAQRTCWESPDAAEGLKAFVEKRAARFGAATAESAPSRFE